MLLSLVVWVGGIIFFSFVVAPAVFSGILPSHDLAGKIVGRSLGALHWIGLSSGLVFLAASLIDSRIANGFARPCAVRNILIALMMLLTAISLFAVTPKMDALKANMGIIDNISLADSRRIDFDRLHQWSVRLEVAVLLLGLGAIYVTARPSRV
jgi:uncharacterized membrane protein